MKLRVDLKQNGYPVYIERNALKKAGGYLNLKRKVLIVTDDGVPSEYADTVASLCADPIVSVLKQGEDSKSLENFSHLSKMMLENSFDRRDCVVAVGGGVVGDLAGFVSACYMRGVDFYNIPTTLLSQVDSSVGGKTAVDFCKIKNIIGAFHQPKAVIIDPEVLKTLSRQQFSNGLAEAIKMAMTFDSELFELIEKNDAGEIVDTIIERSIKIKASVVEKDEKEAGLRRVLNFGHTIGHGIESVTGMLHGNCVALGMIPMCGESLRQRLTAVLQKEGLPVELNADKDKIFAAALHDKKAGGGKISVVKVKKLGSFEIEDLSSDELRNTIEEGF